MIFTRTHRFNTILQKKAFAYISYTAAAFGSSDLGIIVAEWRDNKLNVLYEASVNRPTITQSIS